LQNQPPGQADTLLEESSPMCAIIFEFDTNTKLTFNSLQGHPLLMDFLAKGFPPALQTENSLTLPNSKNPQNPQPSQVGFGVSSTPLQNGPQITEAQATTPEAENASSSQLLQTTDTQKSSCPKKTLLSQKSPKTYPSRGRAVLKRKFDQAEDDGSCSEAELSLADQDTYEVEAILGHKRSESVSSFGVSKYLKN